MLRLGASWHWPFVRELVGNPTEALLLTMSVANRLYPYVPVIDLHKYRNAVRSIAKGRPVCRPTKFLRYLVT